MDRQIDRPSPTFSRWRQERCLPSGPRWVFLRLRRSKHQFQISVADENRRGCGFFAPSRLNSSCACGRTTITTHIPTPTSVAISSDGGEKLCHLPRRNRRQV